MRRCRTTTSSERLLPFSICRRFMASLHPLMQRSAGPRIDPALMIRMLIIGYVFAIRSERALCRDVQVNFAYRWFCRLSIEDRIPDHSAFSRARNERFRDSDIFRSVFEHVVGTCIGAGLVGGEGFAVDASLIVADANKQRSIPGSQWSKEFDAEDVSRAAKEYLATLDDAAFGAASGVTPKFVSPSDPAAQWTGAMRGPAFFAYAVPQCAAFERRGATRVAPLAAREHGQPFRVRERAGHARYHCRVCPDGGAGRRSGWSCAQGASPHAPTCVRLCLGECRARYPLASSISWAQQYPAHGSLYGVSARPVQEFLARIGVMS